MQTFLPYSDFEKTAQVLDRARLLKQRVETLQILYALTKEQYGFKNHPAVKQWTGYIPTLVEYGMEIHKECEKRGFKDHKKAGERIQAFSSDKETIVYPPYIGVNKYHISHQSNLIRKDPKYYSQFFVNVPDNLPYVWPSKEEI